MNNQTEVSVKNAEGLRQKIKQLASNEAQKMLGVWLAPDGNNVKQVEEMRRKSIEWGEKIRTGMVDKRDAWLAMKSTIMKTLEYPLLALTLSENECNHIMAPLLKAGLPKAGICRNIPRSILYGSTEHQGLGMNNLYTTMDLTQITSLVDHIWRNSTTGKLLRISMETMKIELGLEGQIFSLDFKTFGQLVTDCWIKNLWMFANKYSIEVEDNIKGFKVLRDKDSLLTNKFHKTYLMGHITLKEWKIANKCRIYKQVASVADIATDDGTRLDINALDITVSYQKGRTRCIEWPKQEKPTMKEWRVWEKVVRMSCCGGGMIRLSETLGQWDNKQLHKKISEWRWYICKELGELYEYSNGDWKKYCREERLQHTRHSIFSHDLSLICNQPDMDKIEKTVVYSKEGFMHATGFREGIERHKASQDNKVMDTNEVFSAAIRELGKERWAASTVATTASITRIIESIKQGTAVGVSDGSFKDEYGTACWIMEDAQGLERIVGLCEVPGFCDEQDAYRSELTGIYALILVVKLLGR